MVLCNREENYGEGGEEGERLGSHTKQVVGFIVTVLVP